MLDFDWDEELFDLWTPETFNYFQPDDNDPDDAELALVDEAFQNILNGIDMNCIQDGNSRTCVVILGE